MYPTPNELSSYSPAWPCAHFRLAGGVNALAGVLFSSKFIKNHFVVSFWFLHSTIIVLNSVSSCYFKMESSLGASVHLYSNQFNFVMQQSSVYIIRLFDLNCLFQVEDVTIENHNKKSHN